MRNRLVALGLIATLSIATAHSQTRQNADLERLRGEITKMRDQLEDVRRQARSAQQELAEVDLELGIRTRELEIAVDLQTRLEQEQRGVEQQIAALTPRIERQKKYLAKRLAVLYRLGGLSYL
ncbi:MAG: hypothetical protein JOZ54_24485, partial [Acidobacteria bacterium]|nr:hypothetical protein [Acidobacteriota bacterium]